MSQAQLARQTSRHLESEFTRDQMFDLERGARKNVGPDLVTAITKALNRPLPEALAALGYQLPDSVSQHVHPALVRAVEEIPYSVQEALAETLPGFYTLAQALNVTPLRRVAEERGQYNGGKQR